MNASIDAQDDALVAADVSATGMLEGSLQIAGTLAWALPAPWGPVAAAATTLFELLLGGGSEDPLQEAVQALENFIETRDIQNWGRTVANFVGGTNGLNSQLWVLKQTISSSQTEFIQALLTTIDQATDPGTSDNVYAAANGLRDKVAQFAAVAKQQSREEYYNSKAPSLEDTLDLALLAASSFLLALKLRIQLCATLGALAADAKDSVQVDKMTGKWLDAYASYVRNVAGVDGGVGMVDLMTPVVNAVIPIRKALVGECIQVQYYPSGKMTHVFIDAALEDPSYEDETMIHDDHSFPNYNDDLATLQSIRASYLADIDARFARRLGVIAAWTASVKEWSEHLPPKAPIDAPFMADGAPWASHESKAPNWEPGNAVCYSVAYANEHGPSQQGKLGDWIEIGSVAFPTITVPIDPLKMATARHIYRRFRAQQANTSELIDVIPDNTTTTFVDSKL